MSEFYRVRRLPPYVFEQVNRLKASARAAGADIIDLGMGNPDLPTPPQQPKSKLLSPEEKARVVAELEALARSQNGTSAADKAKCDEEAAKALDPEQRLKRDLADGEC